MEFVTLTLERLGMGTEAGSILEEFTEELGALAAKVANEDGFGKKGKITLTLDLERSGDAITVSGAVQVKAPPKKRTAAIAYFVDGELRAQNTEQLRIPFAGRRKRSETEDEKEEE